MALCSLEEQRCSCSLCSSQRADGPKSAPERNDAPAGLTSEGRVGAPLQSGTEDGTIFDCRHQEEVPTTGDDHSRTQLAHASTWEFPSTDEKDELLRKEVIQPHLPVRLPCYDFTPIANPTFGSSVPEGSATDFGCCQLSWCDGRCVQGPGTYSPRRC